MNTPLDGVQKIFAEQKSCASLETSTLGEYEVLQINEQKIPILHTIENERSCFNTSLLATFFRAPLQEAAQVKEKNKKIKIVLFSQLIRLLLFLAGSKKMILIRPESHLYLQHDFLRHCSLTDMVQQLDNKHPKKVIRVNYFTKEYHNEYFAKLLASGCKAFCVANMHFFDKDFKDYCKRNGYKNDKRFFKKNDYYRYLQQEEITAEHIQVCAELYVNLNMDKYNSLSPAITVSLFLLYWRTAVYDFRILVFKKTGKICSFFCYQQQDDMLIVGPTGRDITMSDDSGIGRLNLFHFLKLANELDKKACYGFANDAFKLLRGSRPCIAYTMLYYRHLPWHRRAAYHCLYLINKYIVEPVLRNTVF